jgi:transcriptional regulator with XRE-family HTH domain
VIDRRPPPTLGDIIRKQRELAELPLRQLAAMVGISNPYLSQIERGLRAPSKGVLDAIADSLRTSSDALYRQAATVADGQPARPPVLAAIADDPNLTVRQRHALVEVYTALTEATIARRRRPGLTHDGRRPRTTRDPGPSSVAD